MHIKKSLRLQTYPVLCRRSLNKLPESAANQQWLFLKGQSCCVLKSGLHRWGPEQGFRRCFADGLNQSLVSSVAQARLVLAS